MLWLTWRQHRPQVLITAALLAGIGVFLLVHGLRTATVAAGTAGPDLERVLGDRFRLVYQGLGWLPLVPVLVGVFWGAPVLAREFERGTYRVAWTQSVGRGRWLAVKLGGLGLLVALGGTALGAMVSAWLHAFDGTRFADRFGNSEMFGGTGVAAAAWWLFAFALGVAAGAVTRRLLPAIAVTLAVFFAVLFAVVVVGREHYAEPVRVVGDLDQEPAGALVVYRGWLDRAGHEYLTDDPPDCAAEGASDYLDCLRENGYRSTMYLHPADRYWRFQWTETGILLVLTAALTVVTVRRAKS